MAEPRLVVSLSTIPSRAHAVCQTIESLLRQTEPAGEILVSCPMELRKPLSPVRSFSKLEEMASDPRLALVRGHDFGPGTKLLAALARLRGERALVVTVDDDVAYDPSLLETLLVERRKYPDDALGFRGWMLGIDGRVSRPGDHRLHQCVDVLEGWAGALYDTRFFGASIFDDAGRCPSCFWADDVWISGHLAERGIRRRLIVTENPRLRCPSLLPSASIDALKDHPEQSKRNRDCVRAFQFRAVRGRPGGARSLPHIRRALG